MLSYPKAKETKITGRFDHEGENQTTAYTKNIIIGANIIIIVVNVVRARLSNSADIAETRSRENRMHV